jgi:2-keto-4-pentenoate hydratase/2-oxohepta-3-ene-1,7-dioic acid hydratase in catechol pathway
VKAGLAAAAFATANVAAQAGEGKKPQQTASDELPRNLTLLSIRQNDGKRDAGNEDEGRRGGRRGDSEDPRHACRAKAPLSDGGNADLKALVEAASKSPKANGALSDEEAIKFGRLFTNPGKIVCVDLNYREHAQKLGEKLPGEPVLFDKYNHTLVPHKTTITSR